MGDNSVLQQSQFFTDVLLGKIFGSVANSNYVALIEGIAFLRYKYAASE